MMRWLVAVVSAGLLAVGLVAPASAQAPQHIAVSGAAAAALPDRVLPAGAGRVRAQAKDDDKKPFDFGSWAGDQATKGLKSFAEKGLEALASSALGWMGIDLKTLFGGAKEDKVVLTLKEISGKIDVTNQMLGDLNARVDQLSQAVRDQSCQQAAMTVNPQLSVVTDRYTAFQNFLALSVDKKGQGRNSNPGSGGAPRGLKAQMDAWSSQVLGLQPGQVSLAETVDNLQRNLLNPAESSGVLRSCLAAQDWPTQIAKSPSLPADRIFAEAQRIQAYYMSLQVQAIAALTSATQYQAARAIEQVGFQTSFAAAGITFDDDDDADVSQAVGMCGLLQVVPTADLDADDQDLMDGADALCTKVYGRGAFTGQLATIRGRIADQLAAVGEAWSAIETDQLRDGTSKTVPAIRQGAGWDYIAPVSLPDFTARTVGYQPPCLDRGTMLLGANSFSCGLVSARATPQRATYAGLTGWTSRVNWLGLAGDFLALSDADRSASIRQQLQDNGFSDPGPIVLVAPDSNAGTGTIDLCGWDNAERCQNNATHLTRFVDTSAPKPLADMQIVNDTVTQFPVKPPGTYKSATRAKPAKNSPTWYRMADEVRGMVIRMTAGKPSSDEMVFWFDGGRPTSRPSLDDLPAYLGGAGSGWDDRDLSYSWPSYRLQDLEKDQSCAPSTLVPVRGMCGELLQALVAERAPGPQAQVRVQSVRRGTALAIGERTTLVQRASTNHRITKVRTWCSVKGERLGRKAAKRVCRFKVIHRHHRAKVHVTPLCHVPGLRVGTKIVVGGTAGVAPTSWRRTWAPERDRSQRCAPSRRRG